MTPNGLAHSEYSLQAGRPSRNGRQEVHLAKRTGMQEIVKPSTADGQRIDATLAHEQVQSGRVEVQKATRDGWHEFAKEVYQALAQLVGPKASS